MVAHTHVNTGSLDHVCEPLFLTDQYVDATICHAWIRSELKCK